MTGNGELRHETCRYGGMTEAFHISLDGEETPTVIPICTWRVPEPAPPAIVRHWGGGIEVERDCAVCKAHTTVGADR